jgi:hypothetical protein
VLLGVGAADRVDRFRELLLDVVAVEGDLGLREVVAHPGQVRLRHVLADLPDVLRIAPVRSEETRELLDGFLAAAVGDEHRPAL